jgi:hypothetical protein
VSREELVRRGLPSEECCGEWRLGTEYREEMHVPLQRSVFGGMNLSTCTSHWSCFAAEFGSVQVVPN